LLLHLIKRKIFIFFFLRTGKYKKCPYRVILHLIFNCFCFQGTAPPPPHPDAIGSLDVFSLAAAATGGASGGTPLTAAPAYKEKGASSHMLIFTSNSGTKQQQQGEGGEEAAPLFYQPGKRGFYTPRQGS
jgi:hypothetical protein